MSTINITEVWFPSSVVNLISDTHTDKLKLVNAINSALGEMAKDEESGGAKAVLSWKNKKNDGESFRLRESVVSYYTHKGGNNALRCFYFAQQIKELEKVTGTVPMSAWPDYLTTWILKFSTKEVAKAA